MYNYSISNLKYQLKNLFVKLKNWLLGLSFRTGLIVLLSCIPFYLISFAQFALPISIGIKSALWVIFFGLAKCAQYGGLTILGTKGIDRLKNWWKSKRNNLEEINS